MEGEGKLKRGVQITRQCSFSVLISPALVAMSYAFYLYSTGGVGSLSWMYGIVALFGVIILHLFGNFLGKRRSMYVGSGTLLIAISYGLAIVLGMVYVMTGQLVWTVLLIIAPVELLIVAALHAHNMRQMQKDTMDGIQVTYQTLLLVAYLLVALLVMIGLASPYAFLVLLSFPLAMKNIKRMRKATMEDPDSLRFLDIRTARLVLIFSLLQVMGNVVASYL